MTLLLGEERQFHGGLVLRLLVAETQALHKGTYAQTQRADVVHIVDFEQGKALAATFQNIANFVDNESVGTATEGGKLHEMNIFWRLSHILGGFEHTVGVSPLRDGVDFAENVVAAKQGDVLGDHVDTHVGDAIGDFVLYQRVDVVRASGEHYHHTVLFLGLFYDVAVLLSKGNHVAVLFGQSRLESLSSGFLTDSQRGKILHARLFQQFVVVERSGGVVHRYAVVLERVYGADYHI